MTPATDIPGYTYGTSQVAPSPVKLADFELMKKTVLFGDDDVQYLRRSLEVLRDRGEAILDVWYGFVGQNPHLLASFADESGRPIGEYLSAVRRRFGQWILDTARAEYDQAWLDYQHEIALWHHRAKKGQTDGVGTTAIVPFRDLFLLVYPVTLTLKPFLTKGGQAPEDAEKMYQAWVKSCLLQVTLWSHPYVKQGDF